MNLTAESLACSGVESAIVGRVRASAALLCSHDGGVSFIDELQRDVAGCSQRYPDGHGCGEIGVADRHDGADCVADTFRCAGCIIEPVDSFQHDDELVATEPHDEVAVYELVLDSLCRHSDHGVAGCVPEAVVHQS